MIRQEKTLNSNWIKLGTPAVLVATLTAGTLFNPVAIASADEVDMAGENVEILSNEPPSKVSGENKKILQEELAEALDITADEAAEGVKSLSRTIGITPDQFYRGLKEGKTFSEIAENNETSRETLITHMIDLGEELVDIKLEDGRLTPDEAKENKSNMEITVLALIDQVFGTTID